MTARRTLLSLSALLLVTAACGDGDASEAPSTTTSAIASPTTTSAPTTVPPTTTTAPPTTTTSPPTTTTTQPPGMHQEAGILWDDILPAPGATALYRVDMVVPDTPMSHQWEVAGELEVRLESGVEWRAREGTFDRLVFGLDPLDSPGLVFYFQLDDPWVVDFFAMEAWAYGNTGRGPSAIEAFADAATLDLAGGEGETSTFDGVVTAIDSFGVAELDASGSVTLLEADAGPVTVAAGTFETAMVYEILLSGPIVGGPDFPIEVVLSPDNFILQISMPGAGIELLEAWG